MLLSTFDKSHRPFTFDVFGMLRWLFRARLHCLKFVQISAFSDRFATNKDEHSGQMKLIDVLHTIIYEMQYAEIV